MFCALVISCFSEPRDSTLLEHASSAGFTSVVENTAILWECPVYALFMEIRCLREAWSPPPSPRSIFSHRTRACFHPRAEGLSILRNDLENAHVFINIENGEKRVSMPSLLYITISGRRPAFLSRFRHRRRLHAS